MKTLRKLKINPEKILLNEELTRLSGGEDPCTCICFGDHGNTCYGYLLSPTGNCDEDCKIFGEDAYGWCN